jgi:serine/threonine protein kinase
MRETGHFVTRHIWVWPIAATLLLALIGWKVHHAIESTTKEGLRSELQTLLDVETAMLKTWLAAQESNAESLANSINIRSMTLEILGKTPIVGTTPAAAAVSQDTESSTNRTIQTRFLETISPSLRAQNYNGFVLLDREGKILMASEEELVGREKIPGYQDFMRSVFEGTSIVSRPFSSIAALPDGKGGHKTGLPTMFAAAPVRDNNFQVVAGLAMRIRPEREFTRILQLGRIGESGETYAFDKSGTMISNSRFDEELILLGLINDTEDSKSLLQVSIRDPQGDMTQGYNPKIRRSKQPLTRMAASAVTGHSGVDVEGYNDYRGVPVVGAWSWLPKYEIGVTTEEDVAEAYGSLYILQRAFLGLLFLLLAGSIAIFVFTLLVSRLRRKAREAAIKARKLGQYQLEQKLGEGAMGVVYRGRHAMMRRPTAIKLINSKRLSERAISGFEREAQVTSELTHPNTVAIYDFGRTPEGVFYYAMEYLEGIDLQRLVHDYGRIQPGRVIHIMRQVCDSLTEAHMHGLVHRDVKPANLMLNRRGGLADVVKVLDFGLVHDAEEMGNGSGFAGTPLYMSPEAIQTPRNIDASSDIYAVGAVTYFLATGRPLFDESDTQAICEKQVSEMPIAPSEIIPDFPEDLELIIMSCLAKKRFERPQTAREVSRMLKRCGDAGSWDLDDAERWWSRHERKTKGLSAATLSTRTVPAISGKLKDAPLSSVGTGSSTAAMIAKPSTIRPDHRPIDTASESLTHKDEDDENGPDGSPEE